MFNLPKYGIIHASIWDTAGQESFHELTGSIMNSSDGLILMYSIDNRESFKMVQNLWKRLIKKHSYQSTRVILVGNKLDTVMDVDETISENKVRDPVKYVSYDEGA